MPALYAVALITTASQEWLPHIRRQRHRRFGMELTATQSSLHTSVHEGMCCLQLSNMYRAFNSRGRCTHMYDVCMHRLAFNLHGRAEH